MEYINKILNNDLFKILLLLLVMDIIFGILKSIRKRKLSSTIGIDGIIRKMGMIISLIFFMIIDEMLHINLIAFVPEDIRTFLGWEDVGIGSICNLMFIIFELLSIFKNMVACKIPIFKKFQLFLEKILNEFTQEGKHE